MRRSSGIKYELCRDVHGLDPSHSEKSRSFPTLTTIMKYCELFKRNSGWLLILSSQVDQGRISEQDFFTIIHDWEHLQSIADEKVDELIIEFEKLINEHCYFNH